MSLVELMADDHFSAGVFCASLINFYGYFLKQASFEFLDNFDFYNIYMKLDKLTFL